MNAGTARGSPPSGRGLRSAARLVAPFVSLSLAAACLLDAGSAQACTCGCARRDFTPEDGASVPANLPSLVWSGGLSEDVVTLAALVGQTEVPIDVTMTPIQPTGWLVTPSAPLEVGTTYRARGVNDFCSSDPSDTVVDFGVVDTAPLPATDDLGTLQVSPPVTGSLTVAAGSYCSVPIDTTYVDVAMTLSAEAAPWADVLLFTTWVDGEVWQPREDDCAHYPPGRSWVGRGADRMFVRCPDQTPIFGASLEPGEHHVQMSARVPGVAWEQWSDTVAFTLSCPGEPPPGDGDAAAVHEDAGCATAANVPRPGAAPWLLAVAGLFALRRRRR